jgi:hypothetical protein
MVKNNDVDATMLGAQPSSAAIGVTSARRASTLIRLTSRETPLRQSPMRYGVAMNDML